MTKVPPTWMTLGAHRRRPIDGASPIQSGSTLMEGSAGTGLYGLS